MFAGKIIAGDSAGANVLASVFYSQSAGVLEGFEIIPIKIICHYVAENKDKLNGVKSDLETLFLGEYQIRVFYGD